MDRGDAVRDAGADTGGLAVGEPPCDGPARTWANTARENGVGRVVGGGGAGVGVGDIPAAVPGRWRGTNIMTGAGGWASRLGGGAGVGLTGLALGGWNT